MKIAFFGDVHCSIRKEFNQHSDRTGSTRLDKVIDSLEFIRQYCVDNDIDTVVCTGDLFHVRHKIDVRVFNAVYSEIIRFQESNLNIVLVAGNHDEIDNSDDHESSIRTMGLIPGVHIVEENRNICISDKVWLYCVPYSKNTKSVIEYIDSVEDNPELTKILVAHLGVSGAVVGSNSYPMQDAFSVEDLRPDVFKYVALGHYHDYQMLNGTSNAFYTGSPIQHNFGESEKKGFVVVDTSKRWDVTFIEIPSPKFVTVDNEVTDEQLRYHADAGNYMRVSLLESEVDEFTARVPHNLQYKIELRKEFKTEQRIDISVGMNFTEVVSKYADEFMPESKDIGLKILAEVENI